MADRFETPTSGELLDEVDRNGVPTGLVLPKSEIHRRGLRHLDGHVFVTDGVRMLLQVRAADKLIMPGKKDISVGYHIGSGEPPRTAGVRETDEELRWKLPPERFIFIGTLAVDLELDNGEGGTWTHRTVGHNFVVVEHNLANMTFDVPKDEVAGTELIEIDQLREDLDDPVRSQMYAPQPRELWELGFIGMRSATS